MKEPELIEWHLPDGEEERKAETRITTLSVLRALRTQARVPHRAKYFNASRGIWEQSEYKEPQPYTLPSPCCPGCIPAPGSGWWMKQEPGEVCSS